MAGDHPGDRDYIRQVETVADARKLADMIRDASGDQETALRTYFGDLTFEDLHRLARSADTRAEPKGNVVVLHGIMGGELSCSRADVDPDLVWLNVFRLIMGQFDRLAIDAERGVHVTATGVLKRYYGQQLLSLLKDGWNVHAFWYDWRLDIAASADRLADFLDTWFPGKPAHLVAHSMGGLVARSFIQRHPERWKAMWDRAADGAAGGRLVMLGTPNYGSFAIPQLLFGLNGVLRKLALVDVRHSLQQLLAIIADFVGPYEMLPSPGSPGCGEPFYRPETYPHLAIDPGRFDRARRFHQELAGVIDPDRMVYVAGYDQPTYVGVKDGTPLSSFDAYEVSARGDGTVPHRLGLLTAPDGRPVPAFYARAEHGSLPCDPDVMSAMDCILRTGTTTALAWELPAGIRGDEDENLLRRALADRRASEEQHVLQMAAPFRAAFCSRGEADPPAMITETERELENALVRDFLGRGAGTSVHGASAVTAATLGVVPPAGKICIRLARLDIGKVAKVSLDDDLPVQATAVGHYIGVRPTAAELSLDKAISAGVARKGAQGDGALILTCFTDRGIIRGDIGRPFFLEFPRARPGGKASRVVAICGMGYPGRFGIPELTVLVRELVWSLGLLRKTHLATVLIGSGNGNLSVRDAVTGWLEGIRRALAQAPAPECRVQTLTFVDLNWAKLVELWDVLEEEHKRPDLGLVVELPGHTSEQRARFEAAALRETRRQQATSRPRPTARHDQALSHEASRVTIELEDGDYRFGAVTSCASVPERRVTVDPVLVEEANQNLTTTEDAFEQGRLGVYLLKYLFPADLVSALATSHPLVLICDASAARVHWEMVAQPDPTGDFSPLNATSLGVHRGLTRQLRTPFAPPPEPPPPPGRILRVLIVGDPAAGAPLKGAREEAQLVSDLFTQFRDQEMRKPPAERRVSEVVILTLIGPEQATRTRVMQELMLNSYDILHYCGHCQLDEKRPPASGWVFTGGMLSAKELSRIEQIPKFVFANACESGVTPDRDRSRAPAIATAFAEAFFARGVQNFICTGWKVNDQAARDFARTFYVSALGIGAREPQPLHVAMRDARVRVSNQINGRRTWGAYQHYGDPYGRLVAVVRPAH